MIGFVGAGFGAILRDLDSKLNDLISPKDKGVVADGTTNDRTSFQNTLSHQSTTQIGAFQVTLPDGSYFLSGTGDRLLEVQSGTAMRGASLEGTYFRTNATDDFDCMIEDDGNAAKIEMQNLTFYCANNTNPSAIVRLGKRGIQFGSWGTIGNCTARSAPNATGFEINSNILFAGNLNTLDTRDGVVTSDGSSGFQALAVNPYGFSRFGVKFGGIGDSVLQSEFEAPTSNDAICIFQSRGGQAGLGSTIISLASASAIKTIFAYDPTFNHGMRLGPVSIILGSGATFGDFSVSPGATGTASGVGINTLTDSSKDWRRNQFKGGAIKITSEAGLGTWTQIISNTKDTIIIANSSWEGAGTSPAVGSGYALDYRCKATNSSGVPTGSGHMAAEDLTLPTAAILTLATEKHETDRISIGSLGSEKRQEIYFEADLDFASVPAHSPGTPLTVTVPGVTTTGKWVVVVTPPDALAVQGIVLTASISASNTVKLTPKNITITAINPASATMRGMCLEFT